MLVATDVEATSCSLSAVNLQFGGYDSISGLNVDAVGSINVTCSAFDSYSIALSTGAGSMTLRQLQSGSNALYYNLYTDVLRSYVWGDGSNGSVLVNGSGTNATYSIYGRIPSRQNVVSGSYGDTVTVTLNF